MKHSTAVWQKSTYCSCSFLIQDESETKEVFSRSGSSSWIEFRWRTKASSSSIASWNYSWSSLRGSFIILSQAPSSSHCVLINVYFKSWVSFVAGLGFQKWCCYEGWLRIIKLMNSNDSYIMNLGFFLCTLFLECGLNSHQSI